MPIRVGVTDCGDQKIVPYESAVRAVGLHPVRLKAGSYTSLDGLYGLVLTGGTDVNPAAYGQEASRETHPPDLKRDEMEFWLLAEALAIDLPVLAICRGVQLLNVHLHGTLHQHLANADVHQQRFAEDLPGRHRSIHNVQVREGSMLAQILGAGRVAVNSRHHQAIDQLGDGLEPVAISEDGVVEAVELPAKQFVLGVQWHPEDRIDVSESDRQLFVAFAAAVDGSRS